MNGTPDPKAAAERGGEDAPVESARCEKPAKSQWVEPLTAILMALATLGTAWCSYQAAAYTRRANRLMNDYNALERRSGVLSLQGMQFATIHAVMFMQVLSSHEAGDEKMVQFYVDRFPPDLRKAYDGWMAQRPFENPQADAHPFVPALYEVRGSREAAADSALAATRLRESRRAGEVSGEYLADTVLLATVLFFANASGKFEQRRVRLVAISFAVAIFAFAIFRALALPI